MISIRTLENETAAASSVQPREAGSRAGAVTDAAPDGGTLAVQSRQFCRAQGRRNKIYLVEGENLVRGRYSQPRQHPGNEDIRARANGRRVADPAGSAARHQLDNGCVGFR